MLSPRHQRAFRNIGLVTGGSKLARRPQRLPEPDIRPGPTPAGPFTVVQVKENAVNTSGTSVTVTFPSAVQAGNLNTLFVSATNNTLAQIPTPSGGWSLVGDFYAGPATGGDAVPLAGRMFWRQAAGGETSQTVTCSVSSVSQLTAVFVEVTGASNWYLDKTDVGPVTPHLTVRTTDCGTTGTLAYPHEFAFAASAHIVTRAVPHANNDVDEGFTIIDVPDTSHVWHPSATCAHKATTVNTSLNPTIEHQTGACKSQGMIGTWYGTT